MAEITFDANSQTAENLQTTSVTVTEHPEEVKRRLKSLEQELPSGHIVPVGVIYLTVVRCEAGANGTTTEEKAFFASDIQSVS